MNVHDAKNLKVPETLINHKQNRALSFPNSRQRFRKVCFRKTSNSVLSSSTKISFAGPERDLGGPSNTNNIYLNNDNNSPDSTSCSSSDSGKDVPIPERPLGKKTSEAQYSAFSITNDDYQTKGKVSKKDGRLSLSASETNNRGYLAKALGASFLENFKPLSSGSNRASTEKETTKRNGTYSDVGIAPDTTPPSLNIVVMVIGSRGDIQPFIKIGKNLQEYGHKVRIATHPAFKKFVQDEIGLEFFSVGGDPAELMAFMVKNPGLIPTMETLKKGEVGRRRDQMAEIFEGFWRACINDTNDEKDYANRKMMTGRAPFVADAIIANPPSFAHIHCAERLGIPLHLMFTFPYTPTQAFPHPLANIKISNVDPGYTNFISYPLVEMMTWQGLGDLVNNFRVKTLGLEPVSTLWAPGQLYRLKVPYTYLWSPTLVPKPEDWGPEINIVGFVFLDLASSYEPPEDLLNFINEGSTPIYIGFGSIVVDNPDGFTKMILDAVKLTGVRALVSKGWGNLGGNEATDNVFLLENVPHDWLFPRVSAVIHHGGAGTTAAGLKYGKPTIIVPFFGDQQFWGNMIEESGAGASPIPYKDLTLEALADGIRKCLSYEARESAKKISQSIEAEGDGAASAVLSFHQSLNLRGKNSMRCSILEDRVAVWEVKKLKMRISALAAEILVREKLVSRKKLKLLRHNEWNDFEGPGEPITGGATAILGTFTNMVTGIGSVPYKIRKNVKRRKRGSHKQKNSKSKSESQSHQNDEKTQQRDKMSNKNRRSKRQQSSTKSWSNPSRRSDETDAKKTSVRNQEHACNLNNTRSLGKKEKNAAIEVAQIIGSGIGKTIGAIVKAPMDLSLAVSQGFHNAPRLYGDSTVRRPVRITGIKSGLKAASEEFVYGIYGGVSGLILQPYTGARDEGLVGFIKGVGMGLTGFVLKDLAAIIGPFGHTFKGVHKEIKKYKQPTNFIRKARILEGQRDLDKINKEGNKRIYDSVHNGWLVLKQISDLLEEKRSSGLLDQALTIQERRLWKKSGVFENIKIAENVLEALKKGENLSNISTFKEEQG
ncbi:UDP-glucose,sterol transferase [Erysiphe neolycopersici]|uniref:UDP-glucose,sterol transferase n=1 Tax=Erysiphe neolycopersici TaxID=212602 RepID=A0A420HUL1_9PEZI|nr:UDP-glucose,sterol transferase [Erysiphe neolycopersici]